MIAIRNRARAVVVSLIAIAASATTMAMMFAPDPMNERELAQTLGSRFSGVIRQAEVGVGVGVGGGVHYFITLPPTDPLASGPQMYVVDHRGKIVAYCADVGERPSFREKWMPGQTQRAEIDAVRRLLERP